MGGYEANFNPPLEDKYKCPVCLTALKDPIQTKCGHRLCSSCFKTIRGGNWYFRCPVDNTWSNHVFEDNAVKREVLSLTVNCDNQKCVWLGELRELQNHLKLCDYEKVACPNKCETDITRIDYDKHLLECPLRMATCEHCNMQIVFSQLAHHHVLLCPKFPVDCPICGEAKIERKAINSHINIINGDCPMVIIPCSFRHIGCMHQDKRSKMGQHYIDANTHHLMLLSTRLVDLETKHRLDLQVCSKKFEQNLAHLCDKYAESENKIVCLENELSEMKRMCNHLRNSVKGLKVIVNNNAYFNNRSKTPNSHNEDLSAASMSIQNVNINNACTTIKTHQCVFEWVIDLSSRRKAYFSPSYCLPDSSYKVHLWLKPEIEIDNDSYSSVCVILERCDNEDELPVSFDCCFFLTNDCSTHTGANSKQLKSFVTTDQFQMSGHVSKPMILCKTSEFNSQVFDNNKLNLQFTIGAIRE